MRDFLREMTDAEKRSLLVDHARFVPQAIAFQSWLDEFNMTEHPEARLVYFAICLFGLAADIGVLGS